MKQDLEFEMNWITGDSVKMWRAFKAVADGPVGQVLARPVPECNSAIKVSMACSHEQLKTMCDVSGARFERKQSTKSFYVYI